MDKIVDYIIENAIRRYLNEENGKEVADNTRVAQNPIYLSRQFPQNSVVVQNSKQQPQQKVRTQKQPAQQEVVYNPNTFDGMTRPMGMNFTPEQREQMKKCNTCEMPPDQVWGIVIHYTAGDINNPETLDKIKQVHRKRNYYQDIAYNFIIDRDGKIYKGRDTNVRNQGTSNVPWNMHTLAICYVGGLDKINGPKDRKGKPAGFDTRTPQQKASLVKLIKSLKKNFPTIVDVRGHKQVPGSATGCPGFDAHAEYQHLVGKEDPNNPLYALN